MQTIIVYSTLGCHLCELAKEQIEPLLEPLQLKLIEVDIADKGNEHLLEKYGVRIPVITVENTMTDLGWPFDTQMAYEFLTPYLINAPSNITASAPDSTQNSNE